ncbi:hypothetical protein Dda_0242 [Drechslerella dactyloides]|uniref:FHA domain-containing protein n=1 Tax=Drechslerella dactyloides TaxID=74499 RepID=A0AAD6NNA6_DREDA|nr:hypothetical protein Dda_0242 [Drechslerella dactyloides]
MTAVAASPPSFPRSSWTNGASSMHAQMTPDEVSRLLMPPRSKSQSAIPSVHSSASSSVASSAASSLSAASLSSASTTASSLLSAQKTSLVGQQLPPRPSSSASNSSSISSISSSSVTMNGSTTTTTSTPASSNPSPNNSEPNTPINSATNTVNSGPSWTGGGKRKAARNGVSSRESNMKNSGNASTALNAAISNGSTGSFLMLLPLNGTFERKVIPLPFYPDVLRIGRQTNAKTVPTQSNGFFDSKVLSRQHAEVWAEKGTGRVFIRDVKSSNGTFVNGTRLSPENRDSEPHEIRAEDILELGIDIVGEDNKTIVHHKVAARVQHAGFHQTQSAVTNAGNFDLNFGDIDPTVGGGLMAPPLNHVQTVSSVTGGRGRSNSQTSRGGPMAFLPNGLVGIQRQGTQLMSGMPITIEAIAKRLNYEMQQARQQQSELKRAHDFFDVVLAQQEHEKVDSKPSIKTEIPQPIENAKDSNEPKDAGIDEAELPVPIEQIESWTQLKFPGRPPSQILSLVAVLADTKRDLEAKSLRVKELEDNLLKERSAREVAEGRIEKLELAALNLNATEPVESEVVKVPVIVEAPGEGHRELVLDIPDAGESFEKALTPEPVVVDNDMQVRLDKLMADLNAAQAEVENLKQSLQRSETEKTSVQKSISQLMEDRKKEEEGRIKAEKALEKARTQEKKRKEKEGHKVANGTSTPAKGVEKAERAENGSASTALSSMKDRGLLMQQRHYGTPLASFFGVVVVGVTVMVVLNSWTKGEKP